MNRSLSEQDNPRIRERAANQSRCFSSCGRLARRPGDALTVKDRLDRTVATDSK